MQLSTPSRRHHCVSVFLCVCVEGVGEVGCMRALSEIMFIDTFVVTENLPLLTVFPT